ncbi:hypothetical protein CWI37_1162p0020 [Hamiltosporidium tvaerminnensis]|uniref:Uncharacterized protein n=1 Tax=Hamiltosporidium tvaerminnensis TaxID=1176355 RepID=A0A4Q9KZ14_9MICR|nr:hypothetical protein CWI37_1162p0020 [Hamiltosporidium tvaerminnensis]
MFELFLFSHYLPPKNLSVKDFLNFLHLFEAMNIEFDQKLARIIHVLSITLLNSKNMYSFGFKEELKIKYIFIFELKLYDDIEFIPIDLVNLKNLIIFERESKVIDTLMSAEFTEILKFATEKEIDISGLSTTENLQEDRKKEYKVN